MNSTMQLVDIWLLQERHWIQQLTVTTLTAIRLITGALVLLVSILALQASLNFFRDPLELRKFPAPSCAAFTNLWSAYHSRKLRRSRAILDAHRRLGPIIRIQPRHISFADPRAIQEIYGHRSPMRKDKFYRTISGDTDESIVSTRDRDEHARKRRQISNVFSHRNVLSMESLVAAKVQQLVERLDAAVASGEVIDIRQWLNYFTFDVISMMAFGNDPGFLRSGNAQAAAETTNGSKVYMVDPITSFQDNTVHVATLGHWPAFLRVTKPLTRWSMYSKRGDDFTNMCIHQVRRRLENVPHPRNDFFQHLLTDSKGEKRCLPFGELVQEAGVLLSAGSDTTASEMTNTLYLLLRHPDVLEKLRTEIESALPDTRSAKHLVVLPYTPMRNVDYLRACLDEGLRHLPPTSIGLLRMTPPEGARIAGHWIRGGVTVSVPTYTIHHDATLFPDPWTYRPERWLEGNAKERQNLKDYVIPFTLGRHACIGRNIAFLEQTVVLSTLVTRYAFEFTAQGFQLPVLERINANPGPLPVLTRMRQ